MANATKIEWTDAVWNPVTGCTKVSAGCASCYAERMAPRLAGRFGYPADDPFRVTLHPDRLDEPFRWRKSRRIFVCSMGDLFHDDVPDTFIDKVFAVMAMTPQHTFQVLTKRPARTVDYLKDSLCRMDLIGQQCGWFRRVWKRAEYWSTATGKAYEEIAFDWPLPNVWLGTSIEDQATADKRIPELLKCPAAVRFVSCEPLIAPVKFSRTMSGLAWCIVGAETGPGARPMKIKWVRDIRDQCGEAGVALFVKQMSRREPIPEDLMIREFPQANDR